MAEGSLQAPIRHALDWENPEFYDRAKIEAEAHRVFDICHGCRRCFNLCDSFPRLFDLIDAAPSGELDTVDPKAYAPVVEACTLCDMCFMTKCPYVPPHEFNLDFPHLMLRYRAMERSEGKQHHAARELTWTDRNGKLGALVSPIANWASDVDNGLTRPLMEAVAGIDRKAELPKYYFRSFVERALDRPPLNDRAPAYGRKAILYATCFVNYNNPNIGMAARAVLAHNGVDTEVMHPACCGMPQLEHGNIAEVAARAKKISAAFRPQIEAGYRIVALIPSCALMLKFEWPLILPDDEDVKFLSAHTSDLSEYVVDIARNEGLAPGLQPLPGAVTIQLACHARAQNMGPKGAELLKLIPATKVDVVERCSGHGGSWGIRTENFEVAIKVGTPAARQILRNNPAFLASECPLSATHLGQAAARLEPDATPPERIHPIELLAQAYGLTP